MEKTCALCLGEIKCLITLGCTHMFCLKCFCSWYNEQDKGCIKCKPKIDGFVCPTCKEKVVKFYVFKSTFKHLDCLYFIESFNLLKRLPYIPEKTSLRDSIMLGKHIFSSDGLNENVILLGKQAFDNDYSIYGFANFCYNLYHFIILCLDSKWTPCYIATYLQ